MTTPLKVTPGEAKQYERNLRGKTPERKSGAGPKRKRNKTMAYIKCSGCGTMVDVPDELAPEEFQGKFLEIPLSDVYYCDACEDDEQ